VVDTSVPLRARSAARMAACHKGGLRKRMGPGAVKHQRGPASSF